MFFEGDEERNGRKEAKKSIWVFAGEFSMEKFAISLLCYHAEIVLGLVAIQTVIFICPRKIISNVISKRFVSQCECLLFSDRFWEGDFNEIYETTSLFLWN
jgi:hypothetical protein